MYCGECGRWIESKFCPKDGWPSNETGAKSPGGRTATLDRGARAEQFTQGDNSPIYNGDLSKMSPATRRTGQKRVVRMWKLRLGSWIGFLGSIASIAAIVVPPLSSLPSASHSDPTPTATTQAANTSGFNLFGSTHTPIWLAVAALASLAVFLPLFTLLTSLRYRGYARGGFGTVLTSGDGSLWRAHISGRCLRPHCGGNLRLAKVTVGTCPITKTDSHGNRYQGTADVKEIRLICNKNPDHRYPFDPTNLS